MVPSRFIGREAELERLEEAWARSAAGQPQLVVVWGRRRVGKTYMLSRFARGRRTVFFSATQQAERVELRRLHEAVRRDLGPRASDLAGGAFSNWEAALRFFAALAATETLALVLDEVPYIARTTEGFPSIIQAVWDHLAPGTRLCLILTGSAVGTVEEMLQAGGALRGRPTLPIRLDPLDPWAARAFLPDLASEAFFEAYAACGGYPLHLSAWDSEASTEQNLLRLAGTPGGVLLEDAEGMLSEELPETGGYARILAAIGRGRTRYSEIAGEVEQRIDHPLDVLSRCGYVEKALPLGAPSAARSTYELTDPYLAFWFRVLYASYGLIAGGQGRSVLKRALPSWRDHLGRTFEEFARAHARRLVALGHLPEDLVIGRWWSSRGQPCEVDVLGLRGSRTHLIGEAKWRASPLGRRELDGLHRKRALVPKPIDDPTYALWGRRDVAKSVRELGVLSFSLDKMLRLDQRRDGR